MPSTTARVSTTTSRRTTGRRAATRSATVSPASNRAPDTPSGQGRLPAGTRAPYRATSTSHHAGQCASQAASSAPTGQNGDTVAASTPSTVAGAIAGTTRRLAGTATRLTVPDRPAITGEQANCAAAGTARASAAPGGTPRRRSASRQRGASSSRPPVASTESAKPASPARSGSTSTSTVTAAARAGTAARGRPAARAASPIVPMVAARTTLGDGRTRMTKPTRASPHSPAARTGPARAQRASSSTAPTMMATLEPDTAFRWVIPVARKSSSTVSGNSLVSPTTRPGSRPPGSSGSDAQACCRPARSRPAARCRADGDPIRAGGPVAVSTAPVRSPPRGSASRPSVVSRWPGSSPCQPGSSASTSTRAGTVTRCPAGPWTVTSLARTSRVGGRPTMPPRTARGSSRTTSSAVTRAPSSSRARSGAASRTASRDEVAAPPQSTPSRIATTIQP